MRPSVAFALGAMTGGFAFGIGLALGWAITGWDSIYTGRRT